jgi:hypothetical protein
MKGVDVVLVPRAEVVRERGSGEGSDSGKI